MQCDTCKHNRTTTEDIIVDNRIADQYVECGCAKKDEIDELVLAGHDCPLYEYDDDRDDPCYACPGSPDYCDKCKIGKDEHAQ